MHDVMQMGLNAARQLPDARQVLVVDDDSQLRDLVSRFFGQHGFAVTAAEDGRAMMSALESRVFDLIVLDVMMPHEDGFTLLPRVRARSRVPIIMLSAVGDETDRVVGLELGADDYVVKPFSPRELLARAKAVLRRADEATERHELAASDLPPRRRFGFAGWMLDAARRELRSPDNVLVPLSAGEFDLLIAFVEHPHRVLTRDQLLDLARGPATNAFDRSIDVQVSRLRRKMEIDPRDPSLIRTVRSGGYMLAATVTRG